MATVPTGRLERELRKLYLAWVRGLPANAHRLQAYIDEFRHNSLALINSLGGQAARLGVSADFHAPRELDLALTAGKIYDDMHLAAIRSGMATGLNPRDVAKAMLDSGLDGSYYQLERLARTETVRSYWANQWAEADGLGLVMLWGAERGPRTCPYCLAKDGLLVTDRTIQDHPNGRCTLVPTLPDQVPLRSKGANPHFDRRPWDGSLPGPMQQVLGRGTDHALVASQSAQQAITLMVSQGWTSSDAARYMLGRPGMAVPDLDRTGWSQILRALEHHAQAVWVSLRKDITPQTLYRGGTPYMATGLSSWTANQRVAEAYAIRNGGAVQAMQVPKGIYAYDLTQVNPQQQEYLVLGTERVVENVAGTGLAPVARGVLDAPTPLKEAPPSP